MFICLYIHTDLTEAFIYHTIANIICVYTRLRRHAYTCTSINMALLEPLKDVPREIVDDISSYLAVKDFRNASIPFKLDPYVGYVRLSPMRYLSTAFEYTLSLYAAMAMSGTVLSGSRALEYFIPGCISSKSDWDFFVPNITTNITRMLMALENSGVEWHKRLYDIVNFIRDDTITECIMSQKVILARPRVPGVRPQGNYMFKRDPSQGTQ